MDANLRTSSPIQTGDYKTDIFTTTGTSGVLTLVSRSLSWVGANGGTIPKIGNYLGNPWFCPTTGTVANTYMLFQAQNDGSLVGTPGQPGGGSDNDVWLYRPAIGSTAATVWKVTNYGISGSTSLGPGVLGPECSQDSDSNAPVLHIVYAHQLVGPPNAAQSNTASGLQCNGGQGPSDGTCWWFGQWELVYGDINFDPMTHLPAPVSPCPAPCQEPYLVQSTIVHVNPRDVVGMPIYDIVTTGTLSGTTLTISPGMYPLSPSVVGSGVHLSLTGSTPDFYATIRCYAGNTGEYTGVSCSGANTVVLSAAPPTGTFPSGGNVEIHNFVVYEPHWYTSNLGDLYLTDTTQPVYHNSVSSIFNVTNRTLRDLNALTPPYNISLVGGTGGPVSSVPFDNTVWNEFQTPDPTLTRSIFMSDRATKPLNFAINPEWSDHYICSGPNCGNIARLTYYDDVGLDAPPGQCSSCYPITAVRGAWLPPVAGTTSTLQYMTLVEFLSGQSNPAVAVAELYLYTLNFPNLEISGRTKVLGRVKIQ